MLAMTYVVVLMTIFARPIIRIMASPEFADAAIYVPWIAAAYLVRIIGTHFRNVFFLTGKTRIDAGVMWFGALVCVAGYAVFIPFFRLWGAIAATGLAFSAMLAASLWQAQKVRHYSYEYRRFAMIVIAAAVAAVPAALLPENVWLHLILGSALACVYPAVLFLSGFFDTEEKQMLSAVFQQVRYRVAPATNGVRS
jgi:O-antigen/teichoic acid export membrane protein